MKEIIFQIEEDTVDGGYVASAIGVGITTQADSIDDLKAMIRDALHCHFDNEADIPVVAGSPDPATPRDRRSPYSSWEGHLTGAFFGVTTNSRSRRYGGPPNSASSKEM